MVLRKALWKTLAGGALAFVSSGAMAIAAVDCSTLTTVGDWAKAGSCTQGDKLWTYDSAGENLLGATIKFSTPTISSHLMVISDFDNSDLAGSWDIKYTITVTDPSLFRISQMAAGADVTGGAASLLTKTVTGDASFILTVINGAEGPGSIKTGLNAITLNVDESFSAAADTDFNSVSDSFKEKRIEAPEPGTLILLGAGMFALGALRRRKSS
jgi:hypothetical protein